MENKQLSRVTPQIILGLIIIAIGVIFTLDNLGIIYAHDFLRYWPALIVLYGLSKILQPTGAPGRVGGIIFALVGTLMLLNKIDVIDFRLRDYWPLLLIGLGASLMWRATKRHQAGTIGGMGAGGVDSSATINGFAVLGGLNRTSNSQDFKGGELTAIMGGCEIDFRQASIKESEAVIDVFAFWGGIEIKVPEDWAVSLQATPILGSFEDKTRPPKGGSEKRLVIKGYAIMGGVEIRN